MDFDSGQNTTFDNAVAILEDLSRGLDFLDPGNPSIALMKRIGTNGKPVMQTKHEWTETQLALREETITIDGSSTSLTVANSRQYQVNEIIRCEDEIMRVTAQASDTVLTVVRGYGGTSAAAHTSKTAFSMGSADPEGSDAPEGIFDNPEKLYNYVQTFTRAVKLSNDRIGSEHTDGNPMVGQKARRFIELNRLLAKAFLYGVRYEDTSNEIRMAGGLSYFVQSNVNAVGGAVTVDAVESMIEDIVLAGGDPKMIALHPKQLRKVAALDTNYQRVVKKEQVAGALRPKAWQSATLERDLEFVVDHSVKPDELWVLDNEMVEIKPFTNNGINGAFHVVDATPPGADRKHHAIRGKYTFKVKQEKGLGYLKTLTF